MNFLLSASRLMKAGEVKKMCQEMKDQKHFLAQQEVIAKAAMFRKLSPSKTKAAS